MPRRRGPGSPARRRRSRGGCRRARASTEPGGRRLRVIERPARRPDRAAGSPAASSASRSGSGSSEERRCIIPSVSRHRPGSACSPPSVAEVSAGPARRAIDPSVPPATAARPRASPGPRSPAAAGRRLRSRAAPAALAGGAVGRLDDGGDARRRWRSTAGRRDSGWSAPRSRSIRSGATGRRPAAPEEPAGVPVGRPPLDDHGLDAQSVLGTGTVARRPSRRRRASTAATVCGQGVSAVQRPGPVDEIVGGRRRSSPLRRLRSPPR